MERLPGGFITIAMEYLDEDILASLSFIRPERTNKWIGHLHKVVGELDENGFVHGDLSLPDMIVC